MILGTSGFDLVQSFINHKTISIIHKITHNKALQFISDYLFLQNLATAQGPYIKYVGGGAGGFLWGS